MTAYRTDDEIGVFTTFRAEHGETFFLALAQEFEGTREEGGLDLAVVEQEAESFRACSRWRRLPHRKRDHHSRKDWQSPLKQALLRVTDRGENRKRQPPLIILLPCRCSPLRGFRW